MFPEITRDEVFRIESRRLWLRWPVAADAFDRDAASPMTNGLPAGLLNASDRLPGKACVAAWRAEMERGAALHLVLEEKGNVRTAVGTLHLTWMTDGALALDYHLAPARRGEGLMTEAVEAVADTVFLMRMACAIVAAPAISDGRGRAVLERIGFRYLESGMRPCPATEGLAACDRFRLDRRTWLNAGRWAPSRPASRLAIGGADLGAGPTRMP